MKIIILLNISLKDYNEKDKVLFHKFLRSAIYSLPLWMGPINLLFLIDAITPLMFLSITFVLSIAFVLLSVLIKIHRLYRMNDNHKLFEKEIKAFNKKENE